MEINQFCLKIYDLWRHPYLRVDGWVNGWAHVQSLNDIIEMIQFMDILDIFGHFTTSALYRAIFEIYAY